MISIQGLGLVLITAFSFATAAPGYSANPPPCYACAAPAVENAVMTSKSVVIVTIVQTKTEQVIVTQTSTVTEHVVINLASTAVAAVSSTLLAYVSQPAIAIATPSPIAISNIYQPTSVIQAIATPLSDCDDQTISYVNTPQGYPSNNPPALVFNNQLEASASLSATIPTAVPQSDDSVTSVSIDSLVESTCFQSLSSTLTNSLQSLASSAFGMGTRFPTLKVLFFILVLSALI